MFAKTRNLFVEGSIPGDAARIYTIQFFISFFGLVGGIIVARVLGPAEKGIFDLFNVINSFIAELGLLGFGSGLLYYLANEGKPLSEIHGTGVAFSLGTGLLTIVVGWITLPFWNAIFPGLHNWIILLAFFLAPVLYYRLVWSNIMTGINEAVTTYKIGFVITTAYLLAIFALWAGGQLDAKSVIGLAALLGVIHAGAAFWLLYKREPKLEPNISLMRKSLQYGLVIYVGVIANILHFKIDQVMINFWLGTKAVGIYAVSVTWAEALFLIDNAILSAALYKISSSSTEESYALTKRLLKAQLMISGGSGLILAVIAYPLILTLYGQAYSEAIWPLIVLIPGIVAWSVSRIVANRLVYNNRKAAFVVKIAVLATIVNFILTYLFIIIINLGIIGASIASTLSYLLFALIIIIYPQPESLTVSNKATNS